MTKMLSNIGFYETVHDFFFLHIICFLFIYIFKVNVIKSARLLTYFKVGCFIFANIYALHFYCYFIIVISL